MSFWWIKPERKAIDINCANKITLRGGCSSWNLQSPCCHGYFQQVAQWEWLCHQQRIREAQLGEALTPECNGTAESDKGGDSEEKWWEAFPAEHHPRLAHQRALNQHPLSSLCPAKVLPTFLRYHTIPFPELFCFTASALCSYGTVQKNPIYRLNWGLLRDFPYLRVNRLDF